jgi:hypothetical protein
MSLTKYYVKALITNKNLLFWGIAFMLFYAILGAYGFSSSLPLADQGVVLGYTSVWYALLVQFSLSSMAVSIAFAVIYASSSLAYSFRYTKLTPTSYISTLVGSSSVLGIVLSVIMLASTVFLYSSRFGYLLTPSNPIAALAVSALGGVFVMVLSMFLALIVVNYLGLRSSSFINFVPLMLAFGLGFTQYSVTLPIAIVYLSPYSAIQSLLYQAFSGQPANVRLSSMTGTTLDWPILLISLLVWIVAFTLLDVSLLKRLKPRQLEEARQV